MPFGKHCGALGLAAGGLIALIGMTPAPAAERLGHPHVIYKFKGGNDGSGPRSELIADAQGNLYGTTDSGGRQNGGTAFMLSPPPAGGIRWSKTVLHHFDGTHGGFVAAGLTFDPNLDDSGSLYGVTYTGGAGFSGTAFRLMPMQSGKWKWTVLHEFTGGPDDGALPYASLVAGADGTLYGTALSGGITNDNCPGGCGVVFELLPPDQDHPHWREKLIHKFRGGNDGNGPSAPLAIDSDGAVWGTTPNGGGSINCTNGCGTLFKLVPPAPGHTLWTEVILHRFSGADGANPYSKPLLYPSAPVANQPNNLPGPPQPLSTVTNYAGGDFGQGTITTIYDDGSIKTVSLQNGTNPSAGVILGGPDTLVGSTFGGGSGDVGGFFTVVGQHLATTVAPSDGSKGSNPYGGLCEFSGDGTAEIAGTFHNGGSSACTNGCGTIVTMQLNAP